MAHAGGRPTKLTPELIKKAQAYIWVSKENNGAGWKQVNGEVVPTIEGLAMFLKVHRDTIYSWGKQNEQISDIIEAIKQEQAVTLISGGLRGAFNATISKLLLSSKHGYVEKTETDVTTKGEKINTPASEELVKGFSEYLKDRTKA